MKIKFIEYDSIIFYTVSKVTSIFAWKSAFEHTLNQNSSICAWSGQNIFQIYTVLIAFYKHQKLIVNVMVDRY